MEQREGDSGLEFAEGSHRDIAVHAQGDGRSRDLSDRGYRIKSVGAESAHPVPSTPAVGHRMSSKTRVVEE
jgi:hypothetical protein